MISVLKFLSFICKIKIKQIITTLAQVQKTAFWNESVLHVWLTAFCPVDYTALYILAAFSIVLFLSVHNVCGY